MLKQTREYIIKRATESAIPLSAIDLDRDPEADNVAMLTVIWSGAVDEEFYLGDLYAVNVADWVAETCATEAKADPDHPDWQVMVTRDEGDHGETIYQVLSDSYESEQ